MSNQDENELRIFRSFASVCPISIATDSVRKVSPPAPDIACTLRGGGSIAFELVEVLDRDMARSDSDALTLASALTEEYERFSERHGQPAVDALADALVCVEYRESARFREKRNSIPEVLRTVRAVSKSYTGDVAITSSLAGIVRRCSIRRGAFLGPCFDVVSAGSFSNPVISAVCAKMKKTYDTENPVHLLAFYLHMPVFPSSAWVSAAIQEVHTAIAKSRFERLWVYDAGKERIVHVYPPLRSESGV